MSPLAALRTPTDAGGSVSLNLRTLTPLYTGGVGQHGDQIHPSGLLGGLRRFSCLLAAAVGDGDFETRVWGSTAEDRHAKRIALHWDLAGLGEITLPYQIKIEDRREHKGWYYNVAHVGNLLLILTQRGIDENAWLTIMRALRIQIEWATFGSRDQWGLGVLAADMFPEVKALDDETAPSLDQTGLRRAFFAKLEFDRPTPESWRDRLEQGLRWRAHLRNVFRKNGENDLRHYLFGHLAQGNNDKSQGGAINVSALYPLDAEHSALRIWGIIPHTQPVKFSERRTEILQRIRAALQQDVAGATPTRTSRLIWEDGGAQTDLHNWLNRMAGV